MSDDLEGKERIENLEQFNGFLEKDRKRFIDCAFMFPFSGSDSTLLINVLTDRSFSFINTVFVEDVWLNTINTDKPIHFSNMTFKKFLLFYSSESHGTVKIEACTFHDFAFIPPPLDELILSGNIFLGKFELYQHNSDIKKVEKIKIGKFHFVYNKFARDGFARLNNLDVDNFNFENVNNRVNSEISIGECDFKNFIIRNVRNKGKFRIYKINTKKTESQCENFILTDSSLGDSEFQNISLTCYKKAVVEDNLLSGLQYTAVQWPGNIEADTDQKKRDTYRTLKNVAQKNNDAPQAIEFYAKEMEAYSRTLSWEKGQFFDKFILEVNRCTNGFGLNWVRPIIWILGVGLVLYALLLWSCSCIGGSGVWGKFFVFLNPAHKTEFVCSKNWQPLTYFFDFAFRVIEATLIYQTIIAFRKYTRKL